MTKSKKIIFFGTEDFSLPSLQALLDESWDVVAVVTKPDARRGRSSKLVEPAVKQLAKENGIPVYQPDKLSDVADELAKLKPDAAVLASYGKILSERILNLFEPVGVINIHPSLLPKYRGPSPIEAVILNSDERTGVSIMKLVRAMDAGPVYVQSTVQLSGDESKAKLYHKLAKLGAQLLKDNLVAIVSGGLEPKPQPNIDVSYTTLLLKSDSLLDPRTDTAYALSRKIRAYQNFPKPKLQINNVIVIPTSAKPVNSPTSGQLTISCAQNTYLQVDELRPPSGKTMSGLSYLLGRQ